MTELSFCRSVKRWCGVILLESVAGSVAFASRMRKPCAAPHHPFHSSPQSRPHRRQQLGQKRSDEKQMTEKNVWSLDTLSSFNAGGFPILLEDLFGEQ